MPTQITSLQNPRVKQAVRLRDRRPRERENLMLVEGVDELGLALASGQKPQTLFHCPARFGARAAQARAVLRAATRAGAELIEVTDTIFDKLAYRENPDGLLGIFPALRRRLADLAPGPSPLLLVVEAVEKPGNLGAMLRTADAAGVTALVVCDPATDVTNPNVIRSSRGALFTVPVVEAGSAETLDWLHARGIAVVAAAPDAATPYTGADLRGPVAIVVGTEHAGLSPAWLARADVVVRIPMFGQVNSLNVATAASLLLYEAIRQRGAG